MTQNNQQFDGRFISVLTSSVLAARELRARTGNPPLDVCQVHLRCITQQMRMCSNTNQYFFQSKGQLCLGVFWQQETAKPSCRLSPQFRHFNENRQVVRILELTRKRSIKNKANHKINKLTLSGKYYSDL